MREQSEVLNDGSKSAVKFCLPENLPSGFHQGIVALCNNGRNDLSFFLCI